eukprot:58000-Chlamydomonas_euryale.AAC.2
MQSVGLKDKQIWPERVAQGCACRTDDVQTCCLRGSARPDTHRRHSRNCRSPRHKSRSPAFARWSPWLRLAAVREAMLGRCVTEADDLSTTDSNGVTRSAVSPLPFQADAVHRRTCFVSVPIANERTTSPEP